MHIACEQCQTTYVLDERLIPPQGAPVQCTRCGHVFTARPPGAAAPSPSKTAMFGAQGGQPAPASKPPQGTNSTMMFGAVGNAPVPQPPQQQQQPTNSTMVFGAVGGTPAAAPAPQNASPNSTMMFGAVNPNQPAPPTSNPNRTVMFGAVGAGPAPVPAPQQQPVNSTMMFGAVNPNQPAPQTGNPNRTVMFGAVGAGPGPAPAPAQQPVNSTMMFGAVAPQPANPPANAQPNKTAMFGAVGAPGPVPQSASPSSTMMFGAVNPPPAAPAQPNKTVMFGAVGGPGAPANPTPAPNRTMVFGAQSGAPQRGPEDSAEMRAQAAGPRERTMIFGAPGGPAAPGPEDSAELRSKAAGKERTMMFGMPSADQPNVAPGKPKLTESTVRIGPGELEKMMREQSQLMTPPEGASAVEERHGKTQMFAMSSPGAESRAQVEARHQKTAMFAMTPQDDNDANDFPSEATVVGSESPVGLDPSLLTTMPPDQEPLEPSPKATAMFGMPAPAQGSEPAAGDWASHPGSEANAGPGPDLLSTTLPNLSQHAAQMRQGQGPADSERSTVPNPVVMPGFEDSGSHDTAPPDDAMVALAAQVRRRNRIAIGIIVIALLAAAGAVGWKLVGQKMFTQQVPVEAMQSVESALALLRKDDSASKQKSIDALVKVAAEQPEFIEAHAGLVTALTLQLDDLQQRARRLHAAYEIHNRKVAEYNEKKSPAEWMTLAAQHKEQVTQLKGQYDPLVASAKEVETRLREVYKQLVQALQRNPEPTHQAQLAAYRAQALFHAYAGTEDALKLTTRYKTLSQNQSDGWIDLVNAEYALNTRASPELISDAHKELAALRERDSTFFRAYLLEARLLYAEKKYDAAESELEKVKTLKPDHDVANELLEWVKISKAEAAQKAAHPPQPQ